MKYIHAFIGIFAFATVFLVGADGARCESVPPSLAIKDSTTVGVHPHAFGKGLNLYQRSAVRNFLAGQVAPLDTLRLLGIQVQFSDSLMGGQEGSRRPELHDSTYFANELKHLEQYFDGASRKNLVIAWEVTSELYNLPKDMGYYGEDEFEDVRVVEMMESAIDSADDDVDFSRYDTYMLIHAGAGQETDILDNSRVQIFSTFLDRTDIDAAFPDSTVFGLITNDSLDGEPFLVNNYMVVPEDAAQDGRIIGSLGIWAFVTGSRLGLVPLFDSEPSGFPDSRGVGDFDLMSSGLFNAEGFIPGFPCVFNRLIAGWVDPILVEENAQFRLRDLNSPLPNDTACLKIPITESEYFLVVNRVHDTNFDSLFTYTDFDTSFPDNVIPDNTDSLGGAEFDWFMTDFTNPFLFHFDPNVGASRRFVVTGSGVYIWHIDENVVRQNYETGFLPNDFVSRKGVDMEEADGMQDHDTVFFPFSFGSHFDSFREGNNATFGPDTGPSSASNSGARTGLLIRDISAVDSFMTFAVEFSKPYAETRSRWQATGSFQPPTPFNLDAAGSDEIVVFADTGRVYAFKPDGTEFDDKDNDPSTIEPYFIAPGAVWQGAPAFGDIDGVAGEEMIAFSIDGTVYAWKDSTGIFDGDSDPSTNGILYQGAPLAAPPMLLDVTGDGIAEIVVVEHLGDSLRIGFVGSTGTQVTPSLPDIQSPAARTFQAQATGPLAFGTLPAPGEDTDGILAIFADTVRATYDARYIPTRRNSGADASGWSIPISPVSELAATFPASSSPAVGDLDMDNVDEWVATLADGRLLFGRRGATGGQWALERIDLRSANPSAPSLGDVDGNGTLEIALWDETHFYLFEHNGRLYTNWPRPIRTSMLGDYPDLTSEQPLTGPIIGDVDGDDRIDILYPTKEGTIYGFHADAGVMSGFPRVGPAGMEATPAVADLDGDDEMTLMAVGFVPLVGTVDAVSDTIITDDLVVLALQGLPGSSEQDKGFWLMYQHDRERLGRVTESNPLATKGSVADEETFIVYPNPVRGDDMHVRVLLNQSATIGIEVYNLEGERALSHEFSGNNPNDIIQTPFDETIDVSMLRSAVYVLRMSITSAGGSTTLLKTFAILR